MLNPGLKDTISGPVTVTGPLTDAQLRASPIETTSGLYSTNLDETATPILYVGQALPGSLASAVWNSLAASFDEAGTMGEKLNDAGSASNPWSDTTTYGSGTKGKLLQDTLSTGKFIALK